MVNLKLTINSILHVFEQLKKTAVLGENPHRINMRNPNRKTRNRPNIRPQTFVTLSPQTFQVQVSTIQKFLNAAIYPFN